MIETAIQSIINERRRRCIVPYVCTLYQLRLQLPDVPIDELLQAMRNLHHKGIYRASLNINKVPMLIYE